MESPKLADRAALFRSGRPGEAENGASTSANCLEAQAARPARHPGNAKVYETTSWANACLASSAVSSQNNVEAFRGYYPHRQMIVLRVAVMGGRVAHRRELETHVSHRSSKSYFRGECGAGNMMVECISSRSGPPFPRKSCQTGSLRALPRASARAFRLGYAQMWHTSFG